MSRTKQFDESIVLDKAMQEFWMNGYEHTSMQNLVDAMGINRRSMYDTYGDKHALFIQSLDRYFETIKEQISFNQSDDLTIQAQIKTVFMFFVNQHKHDFKGCLLVNTATELANVDTEIQAKIESYFEYEKHWMKSNLEHAYEAAEITSNPANLTMVLHTSLVGLRVILKMPHDTKQLTQYVDQIIETIK